MQDQSSGWINRLVTLAFALFVWAVAPGIASADRVTNANEPIVISDDITNYTQEVFSAAGVGPANSGGGNDNNRSGLGDGTNPGLGGGTDNSPSQGTDNPNRAPDRTRPSH